MFCATRWRHCANMDSTSFEPNVSQLKVTDGKHDDGDGKHDDGESIMWPVKQVSTAFYSCLNNGYFKGGVRPTKPDKQSLF